MTGKNNTKGIFCHGYFENDWQDNKCQNNVPKFVAFVINLEKIKNVGTGTQKEQRIRTLERYTLCSGTTLCSRSWKNAHSSDIPDVFSKGLTGLFRWPYPLLCTYSASTRVFLFYDLMHKFVIWLYNHVAIILGQISGINALDYPCYAGLQFIHHQRSKP